MEQYKEIIRNRLSLKRYNHSLGVAKTCQDLAVINGVNPDYAYLAGLVHDYAKELSSSELLQIAQERGLILDYVETLKPELLHGPVGAWLVEKELGITNKEILEAIRFHTTGCWEMGILTQILYTADLIEPSRNFPGVEQLREITYENLTRGTLWGLNNCLRHILEQDCLIHNLSIQARNWIVVTKEVGEFS